MKKKKVNLFLLLAESILGNCKEIKEIHKFINKSSRSKPIQRNKIIMMNEGMKNKQSLYLLNMQNISAKSESIMP
jgi:hypothetical protein